MSSEGVLGAAPADGRLSGPSQLTYALADGARRGGAQILTGTRVTGIDSERGRVTRVRTERGDIDAETVVIAAGMFSAEVGRLAGVRIPVVPMSHEYLVTQPFRERDPQNHCPRCATRTCSSTSARRAAAGDGRLRTPLGSGLPGAG